MHLFMNCIDFFTLYVVVLTVLLSFVYCKTVYVCVLSYCGLMHDTDLEGDTIGLCVGLLKVLYGAPMYMYTDFGEVVVFGL